MRARRLQIIITIMLLFAFILVGCGKESQPKYRNVSVNIYIKRLKGTRDTQVTIARENIVKIGAEAVPFLIKAWKKADPETETEYQVQIAKAIAGIGPGAAEAVPVMVEALEILDEQIIAAAAEALAGIGPASAPAIQKLTSLMRTSDFTTQSYILDAIGSIGPQGADIALEKVLEAAKRPQTRTAAVGALSKMGPKAAEIMKEWLESDVREDRIIALEVLKSAGEDVVPVLPTLAKMLRDKDRFVRLNAARAIDQAGEQGVVVLDGLIHALGDDDSEIRTQVIEIISKFGHETASGMVKYLNDKNPLVRVGAIRVINSYENVRNANIGKLVTKLSDRSGEVQVAAMNALVDGGAEMVPHMIKILDSSDVQKIGGAAHVLGELGKESRDALPKLQKLRNHNDSYVSTEATKAINKIQNDR